MKCLRCRRENAPGARFCNGCGQPLGLSCPSCETRNPPESQFCNACGQVLLATASQSGRSVSPFLEKQIAVRAEDHAERRQLTVMFCDLAGSTALSERLDPEELREVVQG